MAMLFLATRAEGGEPGSTAILLNAEFEVAWTGREPVRLVSAVEEHGDVVIELENGNRKRVVGIQLTVSPPGEGGCEGAAHPMGSTVNFGAYYKVLPDVLPVDPKTKRPPTDLLRRKRRYEQRAGDRFNTTFQMPALGQGKARIYRRQFDAWRDDRKSLRCSKQLPSTIYWEKVAFEDGSCWSISGGGCSPN